MTSRVTCLTTGRRTTSLITRYGADDSRDFLDLVEWDLNLNDLLDVPDLRELDDLLDLLGDWLLPDAPLGAGPLDHPLNDTLHWDLLAGLAANTRDGDDLLNYLDY